MSLWRRGSPLPDDVYTDYVELRRSDEPPAPTPNADGVRYYSDEAGELRSLLADGTDAPVGSGGSMTNWKTPSLLYANKFQSIDPTQNGPGYAVADGGTFKLSYGDEETAAIQWDATAADVLAALDLLPSLTGKITLDTDDHTGGGAASGPLPSAIVNFVLDDDLAPQDAITLSDNALTNGGDPIDPWPIGVTCGYIIFPAFTPTTADIIENFLLEVIEANDDITAGPQEIYLTDATLAEYLTLNPPDIWVAPQDSVVDLNRIPDDFTNFSGNLSSGQVTSAFATDCQDGAHVALPARCINSVPLSWVMHVLTGAPSPGGVYRATAQVGTVS